MTTYAIWTFYIEKSSEIDDFRGFLAKVYNFDTNAHPSELSSARVQGCAFLTTAFRKNMTFHINQGNSFNTYPFFRLLEFSNLQNLYELRLWLSISYSLQLLSPVIWCLVTPDLNAIRLRFNWHQFIGLYS